jgi:sugar phosphate isomerase/epimerase
MQRRDFLLQTATIVLGAECFSFATETISKTTAEPPKGLKLGLTTYTIGAKWSITELIDNLAKAEIFGVELRTDMKYAHGLELTTGKSERNEAKKRFAESPVKLVGIASGERFDSPDPAKLKKAVERTKELLQFSTDLGSPGLRVFPNDFQKDVPQEKTLEQIIVSLKQLAPVAESLNQEIRLEAHGNIGRLPTLRQIAEAVNHPRVRIMLNSDFRDTEGDGLDANLNLVGDYLARNIHIHNLLAENYIRAGFYEKQFAFLKKRNWDGWCLLEIGDKPSDRLGEILRQRQRWEQLMKDESEPRTS